MTTQQDGPDPAGPASTALPEQEAADLKARVDALVGQVQRIPEMIREAMGSAHGAAAAHEQKKLDRPSETAAAAQAGGEDIGSVVRKAIADHDKQRQAADKRAAADKETSDRIAAVEKKIERPPAPHLARRRHRVMGWGE